MTNLVDKHFYPAPAEENRVRGSGSLVCSTRSETPVDSHGSFGAFRFSKVLLRDLGQSGVRRLPHDDGNVSPWTTWMADIRYDRRSYR